MEVSENHHTQPIKGHRRHDHALEGMKIIDDFYAMEERTSEEDRLRYGLQYGVSHGILTQEEADMCEKAYLEARHRDPTAEAS